MGDTMRSLSSQYSRGMIVVLPSLRGSIDTPLILIFAPRTFLYRASDFSIFQERGGAIKIVLLMLVGDSKASMTASCEWVTISMTAFGFIFFSREIISSSRFEFSENGGIV